MGNSNHLKADILLIIVTLLAAAGWIFSKEALQGFPPILFIGTRFLLAGLALALLGRHGFKTLSLIGLKRSLMTGLVPIVSRCFFDDHPPWTTWLALPIAIAGLALLSLNNGLHLDSGQLFFLTAACIFALHFNLNTRMVAEVPALVLTSLQLMVVGVVALTVSFSVETWPVNIPSISWGWLLASAIIATSLRFFLQTLAQGLAPASHAAVILTIEPIWAALLASAWFDEQMSAIQIVGCGLIFSALLVNRWKWVRLALTSSPP